MVFKTGGKVIAPVIGGWLIDNVMENYDVAMNTQGPYDPNGKTRVDAILATNHCKYGSVGFGVNGSIKMIYVGMRTFGEAEIGTVFCSRPVQKVLYSKSIWPNHQNVANQEVAYWRAVARNSKYWETYIGASIATCFNPWARIHIQLAMEKLRWKLIDPNKYM
ncbi:hypothetical protein L4C34_15775 [Vibrio profundum]|uniref:hypothetical protein n=1 Tax=Vibrio profundum TaxID=2910247 RepID=UPI003D14BBF9